MFEYLTQEDWFLHKHNSNIIVLLEHNFEQKSLLWGKQFFEQNNLFQQKVSRPSQLWFKAKKTVGGEQFLFISGTDVKNCKVPSTNTLLCCTPGNFENANSNCWVLRMSKFWSKFKWKGSLRFLPTGQSTGLWGDHAGWFPYFSSLM